MINQISLIVIAQQLKFHRCYALVVNPYLIFVVFFTRTKFLENKIYTEKTRKLRQNTQKIANFLRYYGKIHSKLPVFRIESVKIYTGQKNLHEHARGARDKYQVCLKVWTWTKTLGVNIRYSVPILILVAISAFNKAFIELLM